MGPLSWQPADDKYGGVCGVWEDANCPTGCHPDWRLEVWAEAQEPEEKGASLTVGDTFPS